MDTAIKMSKLKTLASMRLPNLYEPHEVERQLAWSDARASKTFDGWQMKVNMTEVHYSIWWLFKEL